MARDHRVDPIGEFRPLTAEDCERSVRDAFHRQVARGPGRPAVVAGGRRVSYGELADRAQQVAGALRAHGASPQTPVAFLLDLGVDAVAAVLAIMELGGIAVGLDPWTPEARSAAILEDAGAEVLVTHRAHLAAARHLAGSRRLVDLDAVERWTPPADPIAPIGPDAPAYLLYTSGSTGPPKGVVHTQRTVIRGARGYVNGFRITAEDRIGCAASLGVSQGANAALTSLLSGATFCPFDVRTGGLDGLAAWLARDEITLFIAAATLFRQLEQQLTGAEAFPRLRLVRLGTEQVRATDVARYRRVFRAPCAFANAFGCSEAIGVTQHVMAWDDTIDGEIVPIGVPEDGMAVLLLDEDGREVSAGAIGEIAIKSRYLSPGYWRRPEQSAAAFVDTGDGERLYRTGDLGRRRPDGCLEHHGRTGFRVKINGVRVELEEVEAALASHARVRAAVAGTRAEGDDTRLVAYVVPRAPLPSVAELRRHLAATLPSAAVPSSYVFLEALPLLANGKVDRRALPTCTGQRPPMEAAFVPPRTPFEQAIAGVWGAVLRVGSVGVRDDFFDLGGTSLSAMQATVRLREQLRMDVDEQAIFAHPTVEALARALVCAAVERDGAGADDLARDGSPEG